MRVKGRYALLKRGRDGLWFFVIRAANHRTLTTSESYDSRSGAVEAAKKQELPVYQYDARYRLELI